MSEELPLVNVGEPAPSVSKYLILSLILLFGCVCAAVLSVPSSESLPTNLMMESLMKMVLKTSLEAKFDSSMGVLIPLYSYPTWYDASKYEWEQMITAANAAGVRVIAVVNPSNGPGGEHPNNDYAQGIKTLMNLGATVVGYVQTNWGTKDPQMVHAEITMYKEPFYGLHGVFFDQVPNEMSNAHDKLPYYKFLYDAVKRMTWTPDRDGVQQRLVVLNVGSYVSEYFVAISDIIVLFDNFWSCKDCALSNNQPCAYYDCVQWQNGHDKYQWFDMDSALFPDQWMRNYGASNFSALVHNTPAADMKQALQFARERNFGWVLVSDYDASWNKLPSYWQDEVTYIARMNEKKTAAQAQ